eukprot:1869904-Alexandrium_andersonii.AAC.1
MQTDPQTHIDTRRHYTDTDTNTDTDTHTNAHHARRHPNTLARAQGNRQTPPIPPKGKQGALHRPRQTTNVAPRSAS